MITFDAVTNDRLFSEEFQTENVLKSQYHDIQIQIEIEAEIKSHGESKTISTLDWKNPLYFKKPGTCELIGEEIVEKFFNCFES